MNVGKEIIRLGDRRAANATPEQLTIGEKYRADKAAKEAERARKREEADNMRPMARGEVLGRLRAIGGFVEGKAALLSNTVFMLNTLVEYLAAHGLPVHVNHADDTEGGNLLVNRLRVDDWEKFYTEKMAAENVRLADVQRKQQIAKVDVDGWVKAGPNRSVTNTIDGGACAQVASGEEFIAPTAKEAAFLAMEWEYNQEQERAKAAAKAATDALAKDGCAATACLECNGGGPPCAGQDAVAPKVVE